MRKLYEIKWDMITAYRKLTHNNIVLKKYNGERILTGQEGNDYIWSQIKFSLEKGNGWFAGRFGSNELYSFSKFEQGRRNPKQEKAMKDLCNGAGFFPYDLSLGYRFADEMKKACGEIDLIGVWFNPMEDYMLSKYSKASVCCELTALEPYYWRKPWSNVLEGRKVLVIHPFASSIKKQYESKRDVIFKDPSILPEFELSTMKAVQTIAGTKDNRFKNWFEALDYMEHEALSKDFEIAIIGCGAYGFPLAARLKKAGKIAIHMGGATQMLFGVKGARWEKLSAFDNIINENWIRPDENERPKNAENVENACYW